MDSQVLQATTNLYDALKNSRGFYPGFRFWVRQDGSLELYFIDLNSSLSAISSCRRNPYSTFHSNSFKTSERLGYAAHSHNTINLNLLTYDDQVDAICINQSDIMETGVNMSN